MGTAYKGDGSAGRCYSRVSNSCSLLNSNDGTSEISQVCNLLALLLQKEMPRAAAIWFQKGLDAGGSKATMKQKRPLRTCDRYELMGEIDQALDLSLKSMALM